jgi:ABC-type bacteriocin/lantibiotic exporter with double-glycine peptidase domain
MTLRLLVVLVVLALIARRVLPRRRLPWLVPVALGVAVVVVRGVAWLLGQQ